jgi:hypothetical protein
MGLKFRRGTTAQQSGSLAFGEPYVNTTLGTLVIGGATGDIVLSSTGTGSTGTFGAISGSGLDITGNANIAGNLTLGGQLTIGDNTSDTVNVVASLSSSLIPQTDNIFDLGSLTKSWRDLYISTGSIKMVSNGVVIATLSHTANGFQLDQGVIANGNSSFGTSSLAVTSVTGSLRVNGDQIITGSLYVSQNLYVQGTSSIENITASAVSIGTNIVKLNTAVPGVRYAGLSIVDSGSSGVSASMVWDSQRDEFIFTHETAGSGILDSSMFLYGPLNTGSLDDVKGILPNRLTKGESTNDHEHHITSSQITDDGTTVSIPGNLEVTGSISASTINGIGNVAAYSTSVASRITSLEGTDITITLTGDVTGTGTITNLGNVSFATTVAANQVALGTDTTGDYVASLVQGTGVTITNNSGEGTTPTIAIGQAVATSSDVRFNSIGVGMAASTTAGRIDASGDIVAFSSSDRNFKENITPIENPIEKIRKISGNTYDWKADLKDVHGYEGNDVGVIAQEIEEVLPQIVTTRENGYKAVKYDKLVALLIEGIKEQQNQIDSLTIEIEKLKKNNSL